jgi:Phage derived protein Gp49-like (DUF891)
VESYLVKHRKQQSVSRNLKWYPWGIVAQFLKSFPLWIWVTSWVDLREETIGRGFILGTSRRRDKERQRYLDEFWDEFCAATHAGGKHVPDSICRVEHTLTVKWEVDFHDDFVPEYHELPQGVQDELLASIKVLEEFGPQLGRPRVDTLKGSRHHNMKELRFDAGGGV